MPEPTRPRAALLNADRLDFDGRLSFADLEQVVELIRHQATEPEQVIERASGCRVLISKEMPLPAEVIAGLPEEVRLICEAGTGYDNVDLAAAQRRGIAVCNVPGYSTDAVAQLTICFVLMLSTGVDRLIRSVETGDQGDFRDRLRPLHSEVRGKTLGVIGAGTIGRRVIRLARAFGMKVLVYSRSQRRWEDPEIVQVELKRLLAGSDFVSLHCPLSDDTRHLIRAETLDAMKPGACLVNTARGGLVEPRDLAEALDSGRLAAAALDVQDPEPLPEDSVLWSMDSVILTPHIGWKAIEARQRLIAAVAENVKAFLDGAPIHLVRPS